MSRCLVLVDSELSDMPVLDLDCMTGEWVNLETRQAGHWFMTKIITIAGLALSGDCLWSWNARVK